jgi:hypothetical protein
MSGEGFFDTWMEKKKRQAEQPVAGPSSAPPERESLPPITTPEQQAGPRPETDTAEPELGVMYIDHGDEHKPKAAAQPEFEQPPVYRPFDIPSVPSYSSPSPERPPAFQGSRPEESRPKAEAPVAPQSPERPPFSVNAEPPPLDVLMGNRSENVSPQEVLDEAKEAADKNIPIERAFEESHEKKDDPTLSAAPPLQKREPPEEPIAPAAPAAVPMPAVKNGRYDGSSYHSKSQGTKLKADMYKKALIGGFAAGVVTVALIIIIGVLK